MKLNAVSQAVSKLPNGVFFRLEYRTEVPVKKEYQDKVHILKIVKMTTRTGINYRTIAEKPTEMTSGTADINSWSWYLHRKIKYNKNKDTYYLVVAPIKKGSNTDSYYQVTYNGVMHLVKDLTDIFEDYVRPSYFKKSKSGGKVININIDNIISINGEYL